MRPELLVHRSRRGPGTEHARIAPQHLQRRIPGGGREGRVHVFDVALRIGNEDGVGRLLHRVAKLAQGVERLDPLGDIARQHHEVGLHVFIEHFAGHREFKPALAVRQIQRILKIAGHTLFGCRLDSRLRHRSSFGWQHIVKGASENLVGRHQQQLRLAGVQLNIPAVLRHFKHQIRHGVQHGPQGSVGLLEGMVRGLDGAHENGAVQVVVTDDLVHMPQKIENVGGRHIQREEKLAQRHHPHRGKQPRHIKGRLLPGATQQQHHGQHAQAHHTVFGGNLEGRQPLRTICLRVQIRVPEHHHMHGGDQCHHERQTRLREHARGCRVRLRLPSPVGQQHPQQTHDREITRRQPEVDALGHRVGGDEIRHADVRQHVRKIQQRHAQEAAGQDEHAALRMDAARSPPHGKNERGDNDRYRFESLVQGQEVASGRIAGDRKMGPGQYHAHGQCQQHGQHHPKTRAVLWMDVVPSGEIHARCAYDVMTAAQSVKLPDSCTRTRFVTSCDQAGTAKKTAAALRLQRYVTGGVDGTRTRDPRRDRPVF